MANTLQTSIEISGILSPSLQQAISKAVNELNKMSQETLEAASTSQKLAAQIKTEESVLKNLEQGYADYVLQGREGTDEAQRLARQIQSLNGEINTNRDRLQTACNAADQLTQEFNHTGNEAGELDRSLDSLDESASNANEGFTVFKATLANLASQAISAAASAVKNFASDVVKLGQDFQATMSEVGALSGASAKDLERLEETARQYGATTVFSATEAGEALKYMSLAGWDTEQQIDALGGVLDLAASSGMELGAASDMVTDYLSAFAMEANKSAYFADLLAYAQANSNTSATQLGEAYRNCAANLNAAGQDVETVTSLLEGMANQGYKGSEAGTALAAMMRDITKKMDEGKIAIGKTNIEVMDASGNYRDLTDILKDVNAAVDGMGSAERAAALSTTFTADSTKGLNLLLNEGIGNIEAYEEALRASDGAASEMAKTMNDNLAGDLKALGSAFDELKLKAYDKLEPVLRKGVQFVTDKVIPAVTNIKNYIPEITIAVSALSGVVAAFKWKSVIANAQKVQGAIKGIITVLGGVSVPVLAVVGALTAVALAVKHLWETNEQFRNLITYTWNGIKKNFAEFGDAITERLNRLGFSFEDITDVLKSAWEGFCDFIAPVIETALSLVSSITNTSLDVILGLFDTFVSLFSGDWEGAWENIKGVFERIWNGVLEAFCIDMEGLEDATNVFLGWFGTSWDEVWAAVPEPVKAAMDSAKKFVKTKMGDMKSFIVNDAAPAITEAWKTYSPIVSQIFKDGAAVASEKFGEIKDFVVNNAVPAITKAWETYSPVVGEFLEDSVEFAVEKFREIKSFAVDDAIPAIQNALDLYVPLFKEKFKETASYAIEMFGNIRNFVVNDAIPAITQKWDEIKSKVKKVIDFVRPYVEVAFEEIKTFVTETMVPALTEAWDTIKESIGPTIEYLKTEIIPKVQDIAGSVVNAVQSAWKLIKAIFEALEPYLKVVFGAVAAVVLTAWEVIKSAFGPGMKVITAALKTVATIAGEVLGTALDYIKMFIDNMSELFSGVSALLEGDFSGAWEAVKNIFGNWNEFFGSLMESLKNILKAGLSFVGTYLQELWNFLTDLFEPASSWITDKVLMPISNAFTKVWTAISSTVKTAWKVIKTVVTSGIKIVASLMRSAFRLITLPFRFIWENCKDTVIAVWDKIKDVISKAVNKIYDFIDDKFTKVKNVITTIMNAVKTILDSVWNKVSDKVSTTWNNIHSKVSDKAGAVKETVSNKFQSVYDSIKDKCENAFSKVSEVFGNIKSKIDDKVIGAKNTVSEMFQSIFSAIKDKSENAFSKVSEIFGNIKDKISNKITEAKNKVEEMINKIKDLFHFTWNLPELKLPHFRFEGSFNLIKGEIPELKVDWYANGGIMTNPTMFGINGNRAMVGGEAGPEAILPLSALWKNLAVLFEKYLGNEAVSNTVSNVTENIYNVYNESVTNETSLTRQASQLFTIDNFSLGGLASGEGTTIIYDFSNFTWSPEVNMSGASDSDEFMNQLRNHEYEFFDWLDEFVRTREASVYA